jgi:hypothetical protein
VTKPSKKEKPQMRSIRLDPDIKRTKGAHLWAYGYDDLAALFGLSLVTVRGHPGFQIGDLKSICEFYMRRQLRVKARQEKEDAKRVREEKRDAHLARPCVDCGEANRLPTRSRCKPCWNEYMREWRAKQKLAQESAI